ncbi:hypothetical protein TL16_g01840 [Triparma laevis f. inornata]|uniref:J domain-containing protein n=1 Tax=Triparma laevis f. inornata TaxID=1714386 RepID=A0A9W7DUB0_9STRA|nr:hypothetical protein TL16_g01840 [Triparma laevis f. inornata]
MGATKAKAKKTKKAAPTSSGFGAKKDIKAPFNAAASLLRNEKLYDKLEKESYQETMSEGESDSVFREFVVTVQTPSQSWFPVAQLCIHSHSSTPSQFISPSLSFLAREVLQAARTASPSFNNNNGVEYAAEPMGDFMTHVYDTCIEPSQSSQPVLTLKEAREIIEIDKEDVKDVDALKSKYRKITMKYHPDRFPGDTSSPEAIEAAVKFDQAAKAYDVLTSNSQQSFYAGLGGKARNDFKTFEVSDVGKERVGMSMDLELGGYRAAVRMLDTDISSFFIARNDNI